MSEAVGHLNGISRAGKRRRSRASPEAASLERLQVPLSHVRLPTGFNARTFLDTPDERKKLESLAADIGEHGLKNPLEVVLGAPTPEGEPTYLVIAGNRRYLVLTQILRLRGTVWVTLTRFATAAGPAIANLLENLQRVDLSKADLARRLHELASGSYPTIGGAPAEAISLSVLAPSFNLSLKYARELARAWRVACPALREAWVREDLPSDVVRRISSLPDMAEQEKELERWQAARTKARAAGKKGPARAKKRGAEAGEGPEPRKRGEVRSTLKRFQERLDSAEKLSTRDVDVANARIETLQWVAGERKRLTLT